MDLPAIILVFAIHLIQGSNPGWITPELLWLPKHKNWWCMRCNRHYLSFIRGAFSSPYLNHNPPHVQLLPISFLLRRENFSSRAKIGPTLLFFTKWKLSVHLEICERQAKNPQSGKVFFYSFFLCMQPFFSRLMQVLFIGEVCLLSSSILEVIKNGRQSCSVKAMQGSSCCALFCKKHTCLKSQTNK